tara:strand:- start:389 stop:571 length:183 start_codon:yes stop_codon:yes gene_type:complete
MEYTVQKTLPGIKVVRIKQIRHADACDKLGKNVHCNPLFVNYRWSFTLNIKKNKLLYEKL